MFGRKTRDQIAPGMSAAQVVALLGSPKSETGAEDLSSSYSAASGGKPPRQRFWSYRNKPRGVDTDLVLQDDHVVRVRQTSRRTGAVVRDDEISASRASGRANLIMSDVRRLPTADGAAIQRDFLEIAEAWGAREVLDISDDDLPRWIATVLADNVAAGYTELQRDWGGSQNPPRVQLNLLNPALATGWRPYRIVRRDEDTFAVYGHSSMYPPA